jgi:hypothetical protein
MTLIVAILLAILFVGTVPVWPHSIRWGYYPSGGVGLLLVILVIYLILQRL